MLKIASLAALTAYERFMEKLTRMWPTAWHLVYSADDKCRAEHLERIRRSVVLDEACGKPMPEGYDPEHPWSHCFMQAVSDEKFWSENVRHPAAAW
eukprot:6463088-Amphidinium_carterae.1